MKTLVNSEVYRPNGSKLTVIAEFKDQTKSNRMVFCVCDCGNFTYTTKSKVLLLKSKSCGCLRVELYEHLSSQLRLEGASAAINRLIARYRSSARSRKIPYELSYDDFVSITSSACIYCNNPPSCIAKPTNPTSECYTYNGIDRIDNSIGYVAGNVAPCCAVCNRIKMDYTLDKMYNHLLKILEKHCAKNERQVRKIAGIEVLERR